VEKTRLKRKKIEKEEEIYPGELIHLTYDTLASGGRYSKERFRRKKVPK